MEITSFLANLVCPLPVVVFPKVLLRVRMNSSDYGVLNGIYNTAGIKIYTNYGVMLDYVGFEKTVFSGCWCFTVGSPHEQPLGKPAR
jgi:hypothetical protein